MGDFKAYNPTVGFDQYLYYQVDDTITAKNGVQGKVVSEITTNAQQDLFHSSLPIYSNTSEVYFKKSDKGSHPIEQARIYRNRRVALDFDWNHNHGKYVKGVVHVHVWLQDADGRWSRGGTPRYMNNAEIARYGDLLRKAAPSVRFRP